MKKIFLILLLTIVSCTNTSDKKSDLSSIPENSSQKTKKVFEKIAADYSGLQFENKIVEDVEGLANLFNFDYFYNGAGVGVEDIDNDGLLDIFFCGNQVNNKLFLNKGDLKFEDISEFANINIGKNWSNGITFVDINNDGWKDIYISQGGPNQRLNRKNLLYINLQDGTFEEKAEIYGLADMGISTQSAFFDYDNDGDLDCIVMNENELYGVDPVNLYKLVNNNPEAVYFNSSHLYRNDNGKFVDITQEAGIQRPIFGLGLSITDINDDGWLDFYIASDYYIPDALFINNRDGTFSDQIKTYTNQVSFYGMGMDIADINNDNKQDIFVLDMAANDHIRSKTLMASMSTGRFDYLVNKADFHYQYMYNSFQLNIGNNKFNNIGQLTQTANTDWSWSVLMSDFDQDEDKDIYITNGYRKYALDNDLQQKIYNTQRKYGGNVPLEIKKQLYADMPSEKLQNILYQNNKKFSFENVSSKWGLGDYSFSNGAAQGDLDNDGDLELIVNNIDDNTFLYKNLSVENNLGNYLKVKGIGKLSESYPKIKIIYNGKSQFIESRRVRGYRSSHDDIAHFGLGKEKTVDTIRITWPSGKIEEKYNIQVNSLVTFEEQNAKIDKRKQREPRQMFSKVAPSKFNLNFTHKENVYNDFEKEILLPYKQSTMGPFITKGDINGDGLEDLYVSGASGQAGQVFVQTSSGFKKLISPVIENDKGYEDMEAVFFDFDGDKDVDLYVVSGGNAFDENSSYYADRIYLNDGKGLFTKLKSEALGHYPKSGKSVTILDFDKDGDNDILVGNRIIPKNYPKPAASTLYENIDGKLKDVTKEKAKDLLNFGIVNSIITTDFNNDGWDDFIAVGEWTGIGFFENKKGIFSNISLNNKTFNEKGWWYSVHETDVNKDGLKDYLVGNVGLNLKFKASIEKPFKIYAHDFDNNGTQDIVLTKKYNGEYVPVRGRECSSQQMPFIQEKFPSYNDFANATLNDVYGDKLNESYQSEVSEFKSILLINKGNGQFKKQLLPMEAQAFPILNFVTYDINKDGYEDCILAGNIYGTEVETPRLDAISGLVLLSNGKDGYTPTPYWESGLYLDGNVKNIEVLNTPKGIILLNTINNGVLGIHQLNN
ncbi:MAG: hypothetical protein COA50_12585 [Flavobacteriaceae bacterium]|nr:MAG: hypothetical protein COA50_12585 [Flavobacteriaceae bacterium]